MADLEINGEDLNAAISQSNSVITHFTDADTRAERASQNVGVQALANKVNDFADAWDIRRGKTVENLTFVRDSLTAIRDTFEDIDGNLARDLRGTTSSTSGGGGV